MRRFVEGEDRRQTTLLPECVDDYVSPGCRWAGQRAEFAEEARRDHSGPLGGPPLALVEAAGSGAAEP